MLVSFLEPSVFKVKFILSLGIFLQTYITKLCNHLQIHTLTKAGASVNNTLASFATDEQHRRVRTWQA